MRSFVAVVLQTDVTVTFWSSRPQQMVLYKSADYGQTWQPLQYYYADCAEAPVNASNRITESAPDAVVCSEVPGSTASKDLCFEQKIHIFWHV